MKRFQRDNHMDGEGEPTLESVKAVGRGRFRIHV